MKKIIWEITAAAMAFVLLGTGTANFRSNSATAAQAACQYHRTDNVTWRDGTPFCNCCGQINYDACCKHNGQRYASYDNDWIDTGRRVTYISRGVPFVYYIYRRDEHIKCSKCNKKIGKTGHYQEKPVTIREKQSLSIQINLK